MCKGNRARGGLDHGNVNFQKKNTRIFPQVVFPILGPNLSQRRLLFIPIQFGVNLVSSDNFKFNFKVGPYLGLGLTGTQKIAVISKITYNQPGAPTVPPTTIEGEGDAFETIDRLDFGVRAGLGFDISKINIGLFVDYGLIKYEMASSFKTVSTGSTSTTTTDSYKGNIISIGINLGYKF